MVPFRILATIWTLPATCEKSATVKGLLVHGEIHGTVSSRCDTGSEDAETGWRKLMVRWRMSSESWWTVAVVCTRVRVRRSRSKMKNTSEASRYGRRCETWRKSSGNKSGDIVV